MDNLEIKTPAEKEIKLSFLGDLTCDRPMLKAAKSNNGEFEFDASLEALKPILEDSDYVVGNLETVFAGEALGYNPKPVTYNSPDELLCAIKNAGIDMLTTANNHCLDCGAAGIDRTIELMDKLGLEHTGTYKRNDEDKERFLVKDFDGIRVSFVSLTDSMNARADGTAHSEEEWNQVNQLRIYRRNASGNSVKELIKKLLPMEFIKQTKAKLKRKKGIPLVKYRVDNNEILQEDLVQIERAIDILKKAGEQSDYVVACVHCGGQFNAEPGTHSVQLYDMLQPYTDLIIGNHPHVVQRLEKNNDRIRAYSLGSVNMSPSADYVTFDYAPEYSVLFDVFLKKEDGKVSVSRISHTLLHAQEDEKHYVSVSAAKRNDEGYADERAKEVNNRFIGQ